MANERFPVNLALHRPALQSSFSSYSGADDPLGAVSGVKNGSFGFHTNYQKNPWWLVDLGSNCDISKIVIYNRVDAAADRTRHLSVELYNTRTGAWTSVYLAENEFGGVPGGDPLVLNFGNVPKQGRYVKIEIQGENWLHLDEVEVFGRDWIACYRAGIRASRTIPDGTGRSTPAPEQELGAIVVLTRGYDTVGGYASLLQRNEAIFQHINKHRANHYPLIIWHEGNITPEQQRYIIESGSNQRIEFVDVSAVFSPPSSVRKEALQENWPLGYRLMCKFNTIDIWNYARQYKYVLRIDEDCIIESIAKDPFQWADACDLDIGFSIMCDETHDLSNRSLPHFIEAFILEYAHRDAILMPQPYNQCFPYTNVFLAKTAFFLSEPFQSFFHAITSELDFYAKRWGDLPVLGAAINMFSRQTGAMPIPRLVYRHASHAATIAANDDLRIGMRQVKAENDPSPSHEYLVHAEKLVSAGDLAGAEVFLLALARQYPGSRDVRTRLADVVSRLGRHVLRARLDDSFRHQPSIAAFHDMARYLIERKLYREAVACYADMFSVHHEVYKTIAENAVASIPADSAGSAWVADEVIFGGAKSIKDIFTTIYDRNIWGGSGGGSLVDYAAEYAGFVQYIIKTFNVRSVCDVGCGDWQFSRYIDFTGINYKGFDVVASVVQTNNEKFGAPNITFITADASTLEIPRCDLVICKDVLQHLSNDSVSKILSQVGAARRWLITNDFAPRNAESRDGDTRPVNVTAPPFSLSAHPVFTFGEKVSFLVE